MTRLIVILVGLVVFFVTGILSPMLTYWQLIVKYWPVYLFAAALIACAVLSEES